MSSQSLLKFKIAGIYVGVTVVVCIIVKYILPLAAPFVFAFILAALLNRPVKYFSEKLHVKKTIVAVFAVAFTFAVVGVGFFYLGRILVSEFGSFMKNLDHFMADFEAAAQKICKGADCLFDLKNGTCIKFINNGMENGMDAINSMAVDLVMNGSLSIIAWFAMFFTAFAILVMAEVFLLRDMDKIREKSEKSIFSEEITFLWNNLKNVFGVFFRTQLIIMTITMVECTLGLYMMGNRYALLAGVFIGLVDALPILGTGTVFVPWFIILLIFGRFKEAVIILVIYVVCYFTREFLEPRLMGKKVGISPVLMLFSIYAGLILFGIAGVITGPIAIVIIKETAGMFAKKLEGDKADT